MKEQSTAKVFIDSDCGICVRLIKRIHKKASLVGFEIYSLDELVSEGHSELDELGKSKTTLILIESQKIWTKGRAVLVLCSYLRRPYSILNLLLKLPLVPRMADFFYTVFANNRKFFSRFL